MERQPIDRCLWQRFFVRSKSRLQLITIPAYLSNAIHVLPTYVTCTTLD